MSAGQMQFEFTEKGFAKLQAKIEKLEGSLKKKKVNIETKEAEKALKKLQKEAEKRTKAIKKTFSKIGKGLSVGLGVGAGVVGGVLYGMDKYLDRVDNIVNATSRMGGASTDMVQVLTAMGKEAGFTGEQIEGAFKGMNKISAEMGLKGSADDRFLKLADYIANIKDPAKQSAEAMRIFTETGVKMLPMLKKGSKGFQDYKKAMGKALISKESIDRAMKIKNEMNKLNLAVEGVKNSFFDAFSKEINGGSVFDNLNQSLDRFAEIDFAPMAKAMMRIVDMSVTFLSNISKGFALWQENDDIEKNNREEQARRDWQSGKYNIDEIEKREKQAVKKQIGRGFFANIMSQKSMVNNSAISDLRSTDFGKLRYAENKIEKALKSNENVSKDIIEDLTQMIKTGYHQTYKDKARELLKKAGIKVDEEKKGGTTTKGQTGSIGNIPKTKATVATVSQPDALLTQVIMFKNQFILFANQLLGLQRAGSVGQAKAGSIIGSGQQTNHFNITVSGGTNNNETGQAVADAIVKELAKINSSNNQIIKSIASHEQTVKTVTGDSKSAPAAPAPTPQPSPVGV